MKTFIILFLVAGTVIGFIISVAVAISGKMGGKRITKAFQALEYEWRPSEVWPLRSMKDMTILKSDLGFVGNLDAYSGKDPKAVLREKLNKQSRRRIGIKEMAATVNGIRWEYAVGTYKIEGGRVVRDLIGVAGDSNQCLLFQCNLSMHGNTDFVSDDQTDAMFDFVKKTNFTERTR